MQMNSFAENSYNFKGGISEVENNNTQGNLPLSIVDEKDA